MPNGWTTVHIGYPMNEALKVFCGFCLNEINAKRKGMKLTKSEQKLNRRKVNKTLSLCFKFQSKVDIFKYFSQEIFKHNCELWFKRNIFIKISLLTELNFPTFFSKYERIMLTKVFECWSNKWNSWLSTFVQKQKILPKKGFRYFVRKPNYSHSRVKWYWRINYSANSIFARQSVTKSSMCSTFIP